MTLSVAVTSTKNASVRSATSSQDGLYAPGSMAVPKASTAAAAVGWAASARGSSPRDRLAASGPSLRRPIGQPSDHTELVGRQPGAPADLVAPAADGRSAYPVKPGHRIAKGRGARHGWPPRSAASRDDATDHDQKAHRGQPTSRWSDGWVLAAELATSTSSPPPSTQSSGKRNITDDAMKDIRGRPPVDSRSTTYRGSHIPWVAWQVVHSPGTLTRKDPRRPAARRPAPPRTSLVNRT